MIDMSILQLVKLLKHVNGLFYCSFILEQSTHIYMLITGKPISFVM